MKLFRLDPHLHFKQTVLDVRSMYSVLLKDTQITSRPLCFTYFFFCPIFYEMTK